MTEKLRTSGKSRVRQVIYRTKWNICHDVNAAEGRHRVCEAGELDRLVFLRFARARN